MFPSYILNLPVIALLLFSASGVIMGDYFAKTWSETKFSGYLILAFLGYLISAFFYIPSLLKEQLVITSIIWSFISIAGFLFIGFVVFKESFSSIQIVGIILGLISLAILTFSK